MVPRLPAVAPPSPFGDRSNLMTGSHHRRACAWSRWISRTGVVCALVLTVSPDALSARQTVAVTDSLIERARAEGREAANGAVVWPFYVLPVPGMAITGFGLPILLGETEDLGSNDPETRLVLGGLALVGAAFALAQWSPTGPSSRHMESIESPSPEWRQAYREAYSDRYRSRRLRATRWGSLGGAVAGVGFLLLVGIALAGSS